LVQMPQRYYKKSLIGKACMAIVMLLCLVVLIQTLGVPVTLLNPVEPADTQRVSILEGFSVPSSLPTLKSLFETGTARDAQPSIQLPVLTSVLFHPPVS
jgi:hypothetical protein